MIRLMPALTFVFLAQAAAAYDPVNETVTGHAVPKDLQAVGVDEHLGAQLDLTMEFTADDGVTAPLGRFFGGHKPVLMAMVYYNCPSLCSYHLNSVNDTIKQLKWTTGDKFEWWRSAWITPRRPNLRAKRRPITSRLMVGPRAKKAGIF